MSEPALKCENNSNLKQIYPLKLFIAFKMVYSCCFSFGGNLDFPEFIKKSFITSTTGLCSLLRGPTQLFISCYYPRCSGFDFACIKVEVANGRCGGPKAKYNETSRNVCTEEYI